MKFKLFDHVKIELKGAKLKADPSRAEQLIFVQGQRGLITGFNAITTFHTEFQVENTIYNVTFKAPSRAESAILHVEQFYEDEIEFL